jgi:hypothetical protein
MAEYPLSDPLLVEVRRVRPDGPERSADEPGAVALLERIVSIDAVGFHEGADTLPDRGALPRHRRVSAPVRRVAIGSVAAAVVAGAVAAGLGLVGSGGHQPTATGTLTIQAVAHRTRAALTAALAQDVEYLVTKTTYPQTEAIPARTVYEWTDGTKTNIEVVNPSGALFEDVWFSGSPSDPSGTTEVLYPVHAWWTNAVPIVATQMQDVTGHDIAARMQGWVNAGQLSVVGTPTIAEQKTIEVSGNALTLGQAARTLPVTTVSTHTFELTMWLDPSTYLPVQLMTTYSTPTNSGRTTSTTSSVSWLPPTTANLAKLQGQIPSGFTHTTGQPAIATGSLPTTAK